VPAALRTASVSRRGIPKTRIARLGCQRNPVTTGQTLTERGRKTNEESPNEVSTMMILVTAMFLLALVLLALYLYVSGVFTNRRAFQFGFYILLVFFALTIGIGIHSYQGYDLPATTSVSLSEVLPEP
jgi:predicted RND superfamily exporter protein